jgi:hypothetical protein
MRARRWRTSLLWLGGLAALARAVIISAPGKCAGFLQQLSSGHSGSPLMVIRWLFPVPRERKTGATAASHSGASSAIPSFLSRRGACAPRLTPRPVPHQPAAGRGRTRLRAPGRGSGERRRRRRPDRRRSS